MKLDREINEDDLIGLVRCVVHLYSVPDNITCRVIKLDLAGGGAEIRMECASGNTEYHVEFAVPSQCLRYYWDIDELIGTVRRRLEENVKKLKRVAEYQPT